MKIKMSNINTSSFYIKAVLIVASGLLLYFASQLDSLIDELKSVKEEPAKALWSKRLILGDTIEISGNRAFFKDGEVIVDADSIGFLTSDPLYLAEYTTKDRSIFGSFTPQYLCSEYKCYYIRNLSKDLNQNLNRAALKS